MIATDFGQYQSNDTITIEESESVKYNNRISHKSKKKIVKKKKTGYTNHSSDPEGTEQIKNELQKYEQILDLERKIINEDELEEASGETEVSEQYFPDESNSKKQITEQKSINNDTSSNHCISEPVNSESDDCEDDQPEIQSRHDNTLKQIRIKNQEEQILHSEKNKLIIPKDNNEQKSKQNNEKTEDIQKINNMKSIETNKENDDHRIISKEDEEKTKHHHHYHIHIHRKHHKTDESNDKTNQDSHSHKHHKKNNKYESRKEEKLQLEKEKAEKRKEKREKKHKKRLAKIESHFHHH